MLGSRSALALLTLTTSIIAARALGPAGRGLMAVALAVNATLMQVGHVGLVSANPYYAARDPTMAPRIVTNSLWWAGILGMTLIGGGLAVKWAFPGVFAGVGWTTILVALIALPLSLAGLLLQSVLLAQGRTFAYNLPQVALGLASVVTLAIVTTFADLSVPLAVAIVLGQWVVAAPIYYSLLRAHRRGTTWLPDIPLARGMFAYAMRIYAATVLAFLVIRFDLFLVNSYLGARQAGLYSVAAIMAEALFLLPMAVATNVFARVARGQDSATTAVAFRLTAVAYLVACTVAGFAARPVIVLAFGERFRESVNLFYWLLPGVFSLGLLTILSYHFAGKGYPWEAGAYWLGGLAVNIALNVAFLRAEGTYFAALASTITYCLLLVVHVQLFARSEGGYSQLRPRIGDVLAIVRRETPDTT
jgi:O-antigen/teichoic acid export membrane protein